ncbi:hypothetical protein ACHQM5_020971 [Ranunculus cassubicifolius]
MSIRPLARSVSFSPDIRENYPDISYKHKSGSRIVSKKIKVAGIFSFRLPRASNFSPMRILKSVSAKVEKALRLITVRRRRSSSKVSSPYMGRSRSYASQVDSHHAEAIEDCIEFINSSSLQRSYSVCDNNGWN